ncbi:MAG: hypothetical protein ACR2NP_18770, partial [Pirellulaceae bacterium]
MRVVSFAVHSLPAVLLICCGWSGDLQAQPAQPSAAAQAAADAAITETSLRADIKFLADDALEGRGPGTRGDILAMRYIASQFELAGLQPAAPGGGWIQEVPLVGVTTRPPDAITFAYSDRSLELTNHDDFIVISGLPSERSGFSHVEVVFVGYGMQAPEYEWDDFKDVNVQGKVLLIMNNDPADDEALFAGRTRQYYGRWDYKYAKAAEMGAVGALIIHT